MQPESNPEFEYKYDAISIQSDTCRTSLGLSNDIVFTTKRRHQNQQQQTSSSSGGMGGTRVVSGTMGPRRDKRSQSDDFIARSNHHRCPLTPQLPSSRSAVQTPYPVHIDDRLSSPQQQHSHRGQHQQQKAPQAQGSKSMLTSSSSSLLSNATTNDCSQIRSQGAKVGCHSPNHNTNNNNNYHNKSASESGPVKLSPREASVLLEQERHRLRLFEMRSISAQCSPIMPRHIEFEGVLNVSNSAPISLHPVQDNVEPMDAGGAGVMLDATPVKSHRRHNHHKSKSQRAAEYLAAQIDFDSLASYPMVNPKTQGIISSFNHLKSPNLPRVIPMRQQPQPQNGKDLQTSNSARPKKGDYQSTSATTATTTMTTTCVGGDCIPQVVAGKCRKGGRSTGQAKGGARYYDDDNNEPRQSSEWNHVTK